MRLPTNRPPTSPGQILKELFLIPGGISQLQLARHLKWTPAKVNNIIAGRLGITAASALALADALGTTPELWMNAQTATDLYKASQSHTRRKPLPLRSRPAA